MFDIFNRHSAATRKAGLLVGILRILLLLIALIAPVPPDMRP